MPTTDTNVPQVVVNKLTKAQYEAATKEPTEFYVVTDEQIETSDIADGAVTSEKIDFTTSSPSITPDSQYISQMGTTRVQQFGQIVFVSMGFSTGSVTVPAGTTIFTGLPVPSSSQVNVTGMVGGTVARFALDGFGNFFVGGTSNALPASSAANFSFCYII